MTTYQAIELDPWVALGDRTRRQIFGLLARRPRSVGELADELPVSRPAVSQHLKVLKGAALVQVRPEGTRRIYAVDADGLAAIRSELETFWSAALTNFKELVEADEPSGTTKEKR
ncbi:ArsR/SmtB family transcription factor [Nocardioides silvaticus]|uniref:ArsR/SmtB family transcription factor n=1 Tax=Nocardioides silvaticus TaxID=2201891 RepID=UPI001B86E71D|nr:metalloregulator ArsR/SmtB family transcription factor [Nocardioides silvaticus]